jgi:hypothetical protein
MDAGWQDAFPFLGLIPGIVCTLRSVGVAGMVCVITNSIVLGLYGFLAAFFAFGHYR